MLSIIIISFNLLAILLEYKFKGPFIVFPIGLMVVFSFPYFLDGFGEFNYSQSTFNYVGMWGSLFFFFYIFFRAGFIFLFKRKSSDFFVNGEFRFQKNKAEYYILVFTALVASFLFLASYGFSLKAIISTDWLNQREAVGFLFLVGSYLIYMCSGISVYAINLGTLKTTIIILIFIVLMAMVLKSRSYILAMSMPALVFALYSGKLNFRKFLLFILGLIVLILIFVATRSLRQIGSLDSMTLSGILLASQDSGFGENNLINAFYYYVDNSVDQYYMISERNTGIIRAVLMFLPGVSGPKDIGHVVWDVYVGVSGVNGSFHPTAIGDAYINDHSLGYLIYPFIYAFIFSVSEFFALRIVRFKIAIYSVCSLVALYFARGAFNNGYAILMVSFFSFFALDYILSVRYRKKFIRDEFV